MYPYKINWTTESLNEIHKNNSYGYVNHLFEIQKIIHKYVDEYICKYENQIKNEIKDNNDTRPIINKFYEMVNSEPYCDSIFLSVKYFDFASKSWCDFKVNDADLNAYLSSLYKN